MSKIQIKYKEKTEKIEKPKNLAELHAIVNSIFSISKATYQYADEDNEIITVDVDLELAEAIRCITANNSYLMVNNETLTGSSYQFIDDLPLLRSQITSDYPEASKLEESVVLEVMKFKEEEKSFEAVKEGKKIEEAKNEEKKIEAKEQEKKKLKKIEDEFVDFEELKISMAEENSRIEKAGTVDQFDCRVISGNENENEKKGRDELKYLEKVRKVDFPEIELIEEPVSEIGVDEIRQIIQGELKRSTIDPKLEHKVKCNECKKGPIFGVVYKCKTCFGFYLCEQCEEHSQHKHLLLKIKKPMQIEPIEELCTRICDKLHFKNREKVIEAIIANGNNYERTVLMLLNPKS